MRWSSLKASTVSGYDNLALVEVGERGLRGMLGRVVMEGSRMGIVGMRTGMVGTRTGMVGTRMDTATLATEAGGGCRTSSLGSPSIG